jgi:hypothetical protein
MSDSASNIRWTIFKAIWWWIAIISLLTVSFLVPVSITPAYSSLNNGWNGMSEFYNYLDGGDYQVKRLFNDLGDYVDNTNEDLIFITGSQRDYSTVEARKIKDYVIDGGLVFILDDYGSTSGIYKEFDIFFSEGLILERNEAKYYKSPRCPIAVDSFKGTEYELLLNEVRAIGISYDDYYGNYQDVKLFTSGTTFVDLNSDGKFDPEKEESGMHTFFIYFRYGEGIIAILSDASMVINEVFKEQFSGFDNIPFVKRIIDDMFALSTYRNPSIVFDETHRFWIPIGTNGVIGFISSLVGLIEASPFSVMIFSAILLAVIYLSYSRKTPWQILKRRRYDAAVKAIKLKSRISEHGPSYSPTMTLEEIILADIGGMINVYGLSSFLHIYTQERIAHIVSKYPDQTSEIIEFRGVKLKTYEYYDLINYIEYLVKKIEERVENKNQNNNLVN